MRQELGVVAPVVHGPLSRPGVQNHLPGAHGGLPRVRTDPLGEAVSGTVHDREVRQEVTGALDGPRDAPAAVGELPSVGVQGVGQGLPRLGELTCGDVDLIEHVVGALAPGHEGAGSPELFRGHPFHRDDAGRQTHLGDDPRVGARRGDECDAFYDLRVVRGLVEHGIVPAVGDVYVHLHARLEVAAERGPARVLEALGYGEPFRIEGDRLGLSLHHVVLPRLTQASGMGHIDVGRPSEEDVALHGRGALGELELRCLPHMVLGDVRGHRPGQARSRWDVGVEVQRLGERAVGPDARLDPDGLRVGLPVDGDGLPDLRRCPVQVDVAAGGDHSALGCRGQGVGILPVAQVEPHAVRCVHGDVSSVVALVGSDEVGHRDPAAVAVLHAVSVGPAHGPVARVGLDELLDDECELVVHRRVRHEVGPQHRGSDGHRVDLVAVGPRLAGQELDGAARLDDHLVLLVEGVDGHGQVVDHARASDVCGDRVPDLPSARRLHVDGLRRGLDVDRDVRVGSSVVVGGGTQDGGALLAPGVDVDTPSGAGVDLTLDLDVARPGHNAPGHVPVAGVGRVRHSGEEVVHRRRGQMVVPGDRDALDQYRPSGEDVECVVGDGCPVLRLTLDHAAVLGRRALRLDDTATSRAGVRLGLDGVVRAPGAGLGPGHVPVLGVGGGCDGDECRGAFGVDLVRSRDLDLRDGSGFLREVDHLGAGD